MSEPRRLLEEGSTGLEADLLRSARWDAPPPLSRRKALVALGVGTATAVAGTSTAAATATVGSVTSTVALVKWIAGGVIAGVLAVGAASVVRSSAESARGAATTAPPMTAPALGSEPRGGAPVAAATASSSAAEPAHDDSPREEPPARPSVTASPASPALTLADEVASLDAARSALARGDAAGALRAVDGHDRKFHGGALGPEATVVRIEALALGGDRATATRLASAYLAAHPTSPHASRLRTLLGLGHDSEPNKVP